MVRLRGMWTGLVLGCAFIALPAFAQSGSSSLTHLVTVTVPPRVKVQVNSVAPVAVVQSALRASSVQAATDGLSLSISATQSWTLSIGSVAKTSSLQWSHDRTSGFVKVSGNDSTIASGALSQDPTAAVVFFRDSAAKVSSNQSNDGPETVVLTVVAQ
jgi:hypothetical protein